MKIIETVLLPVKFKFYENQVSYLKDEVIKGGLNEIVKKLILIVLPFSIFFAYSWRHMGL